eukprot:TRINITY_DN2568_c0_g1_i5.p1 TRINITY_DN2568_c0_g1~~TRINITY_DN2568_c0_g1_i5.p1  ORF type:complete len:897 (-),score=118.68 TRINITY_DN2568_c0_g1_i5:90-2780(-)
MPFLCGVKKKGAKNVDLLRMTKYDVSVVLTDLTARVTLYQKFKNDAAAPIEGEFVFPDEEFGTVCDYSVTIGERTFSGQVMEEDKAYAVATREVDDADDGAGDDDLERCSLGHLPSKAKIRTQVQYVTELEEEDGEIFFELPHMKNINKDCKFTLDIQARVNSTIKTIESATHNILVQKESPTEAKIVIQKTPYSSERDLIISITQSDPFCNRFWVERDLPFSTLASCAVLYPDFPRLFPGLVEEHEKCELIFVVDDSLNVKDEYRLQDEKSTMVAFMEALPKKCIFNVLFFGDEFTHVFEKSAAATEEHVSAATKRITSMEGGRGPANLLKPLEWVFRQSTVPTYPRQVIVLAGGQVTNLKSVVEIVKGVAQPLTEEHISSSLSSQTCSYAYTGKVARPQIWYECLTCGLTGPNKGICVTCRDQCHKGHDLVPGSHFSAQICRCKQKKGLLAKSRCLIQPSKTSSPKPIGSVVSPGSSKGVSKSSTSLRSPPTSPSSSSSSSSSPPGHHPHHHVGGGGALPDGAIIPHESITRVFAMGFGNFDTINLVREISRSGRGHGLQIGPHANLDKKVNTMMNVILQPSITNLDIKWFIILNGRPGTVTQSPNVPPPLFHKNKLIVYGLMEGVEGELDVKNTKIVLNARLSSGEEVIGMFLGEEKEVEGMVVRISPNKVIEESKGPIIKLAVQKTLESFEEVLEFRDETGNMAGDRDMRDEVISLALSHQIMASRDSLITSFVAIETGIDHDGRKEGRGLVQISPPLPPANDTFPAGADAPGNAVKRKLVLLRTAGGFWNLNVDFADAIKVSLPTLTSQIPSLLSSTGLPSSEKQRVWATALALSYLELALPGLKPQWRNVAERAEFWLNKSVFEFFEEGSAEITHAATQTLKECGIARVV